MSETRGSSIFDVGLDRTTANYCPLTPIDFLIRAGEVFRDRVGVIHRDRRWTWGEVARRCRRLASALSRRGIGRGDTVAVLCPNIPPMLEAHYGIPMVGAVLNALNTRLDPATIAFILEHGEAKLFLVDSELAPLAEAALARLSKTVPVVDIRDIDAPGEPLGEIDYEALLAEGDPDFEPVQPRDEWDALSLCYTSGTTGNPKGVVYHHRGAFLNALGNALVLGLSPRSVYLWTLPMFHCNGWTYTWGVTAAGGTHVCLRKVDPAEIFRLVEREGVTHLCAAPVVLNMLIHSPVEVRRPFRQRVIVGTGGAAPPSAVIQAMAAMGFDVVHLYGLTEEEFDYILTTTAEEAERLRQVAGEKPRLVVAGDTRYDQVQRRALEGERVRELQEHFRLAGGPVLVAGSTWPADERHLLPGVQQLRREFTALQVILVPHEPRPETLAGLEAQLTELGLPCLRLSAWRSHPSAASPVLLVDEVGILANIYSVADVAYVGGGFTTGVHSVLEPAVYGVPVLFGPRYQNSVEARELLRRGGGFCVNSADHVVECLGQLLRSNEARAHAGREARAMVEERLGATARIVDLVEKLLKQREAPAAAAPLA